MSHGKALIIAPHADDETFGCGGTIIRMNEQGIDVDVVVMTKEISERRGEFVEACRYLGVHRHLMLNENMDSHLDTVGKRLLITQLDSILDNISYDYVFIPYPSHHQDHKIVYESAIAALRPGARAHYPRAILAYEYTYPDWDEFTSYGYLYVDIANIWRMKVVAMEYYQTQIRRWPHPISAMSSLKVAGARGLAIGCAYAERFHIIRMRGLPTWL